jgi:CcmD family protein
MLTSIFSFAQDTTNSTDVLKSNGKIYVVMIIVIVIVTGLFIYLINLDRKVTKLEKESGK